MPKPFDATLKELVRAFPADWLAHVGEPVTPPPEVLTADLSAVTAAADTLIRVGDLVVHIDVESGPDDSLARRMLLYNVLAHHRTRLPVVTVVFLLRSNAVRANREDGVRYGDLTFRYRIVRVWELPADDLLRGGLGLLPLAVLGRPPAGLSREQALPAQVGRMADRAEREAPREAGMLLTAAYILSGMHADPTAARAVFTRVLSMRESGTYQLILEEGAIEHTRELILKQGRVLIGEPTEAQVARLKAIEDLARLDRIAVKVLTAKSWDGLLRVR